MSDEQSKLLGGGGGGRGRGNGEQEDPSCEEPMISAVTEPAALSYRVDRDGRLLLTEHANAFIEVVQLPDEDGGGFCARLVAYPERLVGDGETVPEALADLGARCAHFARRDASVITSPPRPPAPPWTYRRKSADELRALARRLASREVHLGYGPAAIEAGWPVLVNELRACGLDAGMQRVGVVAFYEDMEKARVLPGGQKTFVSGDQLDAFDWERLMLSINDQEAHKHKHKPWAATRAATAIGAAAAAAVRAGELAVRAPLRFLLAIGKKARHDTRL